MTVQLATVQNLMPRHSNRVDDSMDVDNCVDVKADVFEDDKSDSTADYLYIVRKWQTVATRELEGRIAINPCSWKRPI